MGTTKIEFKRVKTPLRDFVEDAQRTKFLPFEYKWEIRGDRTILTIINDGEFSYDFSNLIIPENTTVIFKNLISSLFLINLDVHPSSKLIVNSVHGIHTDCMYLLNDDIMVISEGNWLNSAIYVYNHNRGEGISSNFIKKYKSKLSINIYIFLR